MEMKKNFGVLITPEIEATLKELKRGIPKAPIDTESVETLKAFDEILSGIEGWESSTSQREQREIDSLTDELDAFIADAFKEDESPNDPKVVSWDDIELKDELPTVVTTDTPWQTVCDFWDEYSSRPSIQQGLREAEKIEAKCTHIECFPLKCEFSNAELNKYFTIRKPKVTACIDWLKLEFTVDSMYKFGHPTKPFQDIRKFLKDHGINDNAYVEQSQVNPRTFTFDIHDIASLKQIDAILGLLREEYDATDMKIVTLELSLDFWNMKAKPLLLALAKSVRVGSSITDKDFRVYLGKKQFRVMPNNPRKAMKYINQGYTIGIGHRDNDDVYIRLYFKTKDQNKNLPTERHRARVEVNLSGQVLADLGNDADNLKHLINEGFGHLRFTKLNDGVTAVEARHYRERIELFGQEKQIISKSRNKRDLPDLIRTHAELNKTASKAVSNLSRNF